MDNARQILNKYKSRLTTMSIIIFIIYLVSVYIFAWFAPTFLHFVLLIVYLLALRIMSNRLWRKYISGILMDDVDAPLYREVVIAGKIGERNPLFTMESEFFVGNVTAAMQIGNAILKNEKLAKKHAPLTLLLMAEYNFLIGDDEALALACKRFRELKLPKFKSKRIKRMCDAIEKYEQYLAGDFEAILRPSGKKRKDSLYHLIHSYFEARVALCRGEKDSARAAFSGIAAASESSVIGMMSKFAVESIDGGRDFAQAVLLLPNEPIDADSLMQSFEENHKKAKKRGIVWWIIFAVILLSSLPSVISELQWFVEERRTVNLIDDQYSDLELLELIYLDEDEVLFVAEANEGLLFGGRHLDENSEWQANIYGYCSFDMLEQKVRYQDTFIKYDNSVQRYFCFSDDVSVMGNQPLFESVYWFDYTGAIYFVIDDEIIE